jgi:hypothetical protein
MLSVNAAHANVLSKSYESMSLEQRGLSNSKAKSVYLADGIRTIDNGDTVIFDLTQATYIGNKAIFPVFIISDDQILSLDFSLKYNQSDLNKDTIIPNNTNNINVTQNFNQGDLTWRFSSYTLDFNQDYLLTQKIVDIHFNLLNGALDAGDLNIVAVYLNGSPCTFIVKSESTVSINSLINKLDFINVYPNPVLDNLNFSSNVEGTIELYDMNGRLVLDVTRLTENHLTSISVGHLSKGIYLAKISTSSFNNYRKIIIE